jgi:hypothetical protein
LVHILSGKSLMIPFTLNDFIFLCLLVRSELGIPSPVI